MSTIEIPDCYESIIGLTRSDCECYVGMPDSAHDSLSGLYLDELVGLGFIQSMTNCDNGDDLWLNMGKAVDNAISVFQADTNALLLRNFRVRRNPFRGGIGRITSGNVSLLIGNYLGVRFYCDNVKSGVLQIRSIGTIFRDTGLLSLSIYNNLGDLLGVYDLNTVADVHTQNAVDIELPLHSDYADHVEYFFVYQYDGNLIPKVNDIKCSCGSFKPKFDCGNPYFRVNHDTIYGWADWLMVGGINSVSLPDFTDCGCRTNNNMYGLTFNVDLRCKIGEVLCLDSLDFEGNPLAAAMALAIQNKAGEILGTWVLQSGNLNRFTLINTEQFITDVSNYKATYNQMVKYIAESADITQNDCLSCLDVYKMAKRGIFA